MEDYKPNSHRFKEEQKKVQTERKKIDKIVKGNVTVRKKSEARKFADIFLSEDVANVKTYILMDVLVPAAKKAISDIVVNGLDMILYGESGRTKKSTSSRISYVNYYDHKDDDRYRNRTRVVSGYDFDEITFDSRGEAEEVITRMYELIDTYQVASVADFYDLVGVSSNYTDNKYGWTNIRTAEVIRTRKGYVIKLPKALPIN